MRKMKGSAGRQRRIGPGRFRRDGLDRRRDRALTRGRRAGTGHRRQAAGALARIVFMLGKGLRAGKPANDLGKWNVLWIRRQRFRRPVPVVESSHHLGSARQSGAQPGESERCCSLASQPREGGCATGHARYSIRPGLVRIDGYRRREDDGRERRGRRGKRNWKGSQGEGSSPGTAWHLPNISGWREGIGPAEGPRGGRETWGIRSRQACSQTSTFRSTMDAPPSVKETQDHGEHLRASVSNGAEVFARAGARGGQAS